MTNYNAKNSIGAQNIDIARSYEPQSYHQYARSYEPQSYHQDARKQLVDDAKTNVKNNHLNWIGSIPFILYITTV